MFSSKGGRAMNSNVKTPTCHLNLKQRITSSERAGTQEMAQQWLKCPGLCERSYKSNHQLGKSITLMEKTDWEVPAFVRETGNCHPRRACCRALSSREAWRGHSIAEAHHWQWGSCPEDWNRRLEQRKGPSAAGHLRMPTGQDAFNNRNLFMHPSISHTLKSVCVTGACPASCHLPSTTAAFFLLV